MKTHETPQGDLESEWIAKYRAALNQTVIQPSRLTQVRAIIETVWHKAILRFGKIQENNFTTVHKRSRKPQSEKLVNKKVVAAVRKVSRTDARGKGALKKTIVRHNQARRIG